MATKKPLVLSSDPEAIIQQIQSGDLIDGDYVDLNLDTYVEEIPTNQVYISPTGDDTTGNGTSGNPFFSPARAVEYINGYFIPAGVIVTIEVAHGFYTLNNSQDFDLQQGTQVQMQSGPGSFEFLSIHSVSGSSGDWDYVLQGDRLSPGYEVGQYLVFNNCTDPTTRAEAELVGTNGTLAFTADNAGGWYNDKTFVLNDDGALSVDYDEGTETFTLNYDDGNTTYNDLANEFNTQSGGHGWWPQYDCSVTAGGGNTLVAGDDGVTDDASGGSDLHHLMEGAHEITDVDLPNDRITVKNKAITTDTAPLSTTGQGDHLKAIFINTRGFVIHAHTAIKFRGLVIDGDGSTCINMQMRSYLGTGGPNAIVNSTEGILMYAESLLQFGYGNLYVSGCNSGIWCRGGGVQGERGVFSGCITGLSFEKSLSTCSNSRFIGCQNWGVRVNQSLVDVSGGLICEVSYRGLEAVIGAAVDATVNQFYNCGTGVYAGAMSVVNQESSKYAGCITDTSPPIDTVGNKNSMVSEGI
jgi:hypothetical protein